MRVLLGCDPSTKHTALAWVAYGADPTEFPKVLRVEIVKADGTAPGMIRALRQSTPWPDVDEVVAESQQVHAKRSKGGKRDGGVGRVDPAVLIELAHVAGAVAALADAPLDTLPSLPIPQEWKGNLAKDVYHEAVLLALGGEAEGWAWDVVESKSNRRLVPRNPTVGGSLPGGAWEHLLDAIGLTLWKARGKEWRRDVLARDQTVMVARRGWQSKAAALPDPDGTLRV